MGRADNVMRRPYRRQMRGKRYLAVSLLIEPQLAREHPHAFVYGRSRLLRTAARRACAGCNLIGGAGVAQKYRTATAGALHIARHTAVAADVGGRSGNRAGLVVSLAVKRRTFSPRWRWWCRGHSGSDSFAQARYRWTVVNADCEGCRQRCIDDRKQTPTSLAPPVTRCLIQPSVRIREKTSAAQLPV